MTPIRTTKNALARVLLVAAAVLTALAASTASAAAAAATPPPVFGAAGGCALQCIEKALVSASTSKAKIDIETTVPTTVVVTARLLSSTGRIVGPAVLAKGPSLATSRALFLYELQPKSTYHVTVRATDADGHTISRSGRFQTRAAQTAGLPSGPGGVSSGLGCSVKCITKAVPVHIGPTAALFEVATNTLARVTVIVSRAGTGSIVSIATSAYTQSYRHAASPLDPGTSYDLRIRATDAHGRTEHHQFTFTTVERKARVTLWKIHVIDDGDPGPGRGELKFSYWLGGSWLQTDGYRKLGSGDVFDVLPTGTSRPGLTRVLAANGASPQLDMRVVAQECDAVFTSNCRPLEVTGELPAGGGPDHAVAGGVFPLSALVSHGALPAGYGSMLPSGHERYVVFDTTQYGVKFRVFATVDFFYAW